MIIVLSFFNSLSNSSILNVETGSSAEHGSSNKITSGSRISARAIHKQGDKHDADKRNARAGHELLHPLRFGAGVIVSVPL
jgi:hypothetical protein